MNILVIFQFSVIDEVQYADLKDIESQIKDAAAADDFTEAHNVRY